MFIDLHCDTLMKCAIPGIPEDLLDNREVSVDFRRMQEAGQTAQFFAIFMDTPERMRAIGIDYPSDMEYIQGRLQQMQHNLRKYPDMVGLARNAEEWEQNENEHKLSVFLTIEEGRVLNGSMENLERLYKDGIRLITLTWNYENSLGYPNARDEEQMNKGLKPFGKDAIQRMQELGMLVDVSHLSDGGFWDVADILNTPFVASHSNARSLTPHPRNLTDEMIRNIADHGGVIGLNYSPHFLVAPSDELHKDDSRVEDMVRHLNHFRNVGGEDVVAMGSDLDGISGNLEIASPTDAVTLFEALAHAGWKEVQIEKLKHRNVRRVIRDVLR